jgi:ParB family chromosome partitioning protein
MTTTTTTSSAVAGELLQLDPRTLLIDLNIRSFTDLDKDFLASVRDLGVLVPIVAVPVSGSDQVRVRYGHRRALAAIEADLTTVPVYVVAEDKADEVGRIVAQWAENEHRTGLSTADKIGAVEQLAAFGLSPHQIAKRTRSPRASVDAALASAGSELARAATSRYGFLTLDQAATVAEFDTDPDTVKALVAAARDGGFEHVAQRARDDRARQAERDELLASLAGQGLVVIDLPSYADQTIKSLLELSAAPGGDPLAVKAHPRCPGAVVWVGSDWRGLRPTHGCLKWQTHGHHDRTHLPAGAAGPMTEKQKAERALTIENNKAWRSAETVRREWLSVLCSRRTPPKGSAGFVAGRLALGGHVLRRAMENPTLLRS